MPLVLGPKPCDIGPHPEDRRRSGLWLRWVAFDSVGVIAMVHTYCKRSRDGHGVEEAQQLHCVSTRCLAWLRWR
jgi:hypothetical protein